MRDDEAAQDKEEIHEQPCIANYEAAANLRHGGDMKKRHQHSANAAPAI
jgi:hypothetical protein